MAKCILVIVMCASVCRFRAIFPNYCMDPDVTWENGRVCSLVVQYWADLQSVHAFRCYGNIAPNAKCQRVLVLALCLVDASDDAIAKRDHSSAVCCFCKQRFH